jgi:hypothetical protein
MDLHTHTRLTRRKILPVSLNHLATEKGAQIPPTAVEPSTVVTLLQFTTLSLPLPSQMPHIAT